MPYSVQSIDLECDCAGLSQVMIPAFMQDPHWALLWPDMSMEQVIDGCNRRLPQNLITARERKRYQKVVETETGEIAGYSRWILPPQLQGKGDDGKTTFWPEAEIPDPTAEQLEACEARWKSATVEGRMLGANQEFLEALRPRLEEEDARLKSGEEFMGEPSPYRLSLFYRACA